MRIGLLGGTFDPIHFGHLFIAEEARVRCGLEKVIFVPNNVPAHRETKVAEADAQARYELVQLAIRSNPHFEISRVEIERPGPSFAYDTLQHFRAEFGRTFEIVFIVGADSMNDVLTWHRGAELFDLCRFAAATRPGLTVENIKAKLTDEQNARVSWLEVPGLYIASRDLRRRIGAGLPIRYLVPERVEHEISARGYYRGEKS